MHTAQDKFVCHIFLCEPSSGALCKTIEAACKVRSCNLFFLFFMRLKNYLIYLQFIIYK